MAFNQDKPADGGPLSSAEIRDNLEHIKKAFQKEHNWDDADPNATTHKLNLDAIKLNVTGSTQAAISPSGAVAQYSTTSILNAVTVTAGIAGGEYSLAGIIQQLITRSHSHGSKTVTIYENCYSDGN